MQEITNKLKNDDDYKSLSKESHKKYVLYMITTNMHQNECYAKAYNKPDSYLKKLKGNPSTVGWLNRNETIIKLFNKYMAVNHRANIKVKRADIKIKKALPESLIDSHEYKQLNDSQRLFVNYIFETEYNLSICYERAFNKPRLLSSIDNAKRILQIPYIISCMKYLPKNKRSEIHSMYKINSLDSIKPKQIDKNEIQLTVTKKTDKIDENKKKEEEDKELLLMMIKEQDETIAFSSVNDFLDKDGSFKSLSDIPKKMLCCIKKIEYVGLTKEIRLEFYDKQPSIDRLYNLLIKDKKE